MKYLRSGSHLNKVVKLVHETSLYKKKTPTTLLMEKNNI